MIGVTWVVLVHRCSWLFRRLLFKLMLPMVMLMGTLSIWKKPGLAIMMRPMQPRPVASRSRHAACTLCFLSSSTSSLLLCSSLLKPYRPEHQGAHGLWVVAVNLLRVFLVHNVPRVVQCLFHSEVKCLFQVFQVFVVGLLEDQVDDHTEALAQHHEQGLQMGCVRQE